MLHIRLLDSSLKLKPIILVSDFDKTSLNEREVKARVLFTKNIFAIKNDENDIEKFLKETDLRLLTELEYQNSFLDLIEIKAPISSHSITNEWAIERWASLLEVDTDAIKTNRKKIFSMLYFKYLSQKFNLENSSALNAIEKKPLEGKLLFIDDKGKDGWNDIIEKYLSLHYTNIKFKK